MFPDVLVVSKRVVPRLSDLNSEEISDLFCTVQRVGNIIQKEYKAEALTVTIQVTVTSEIISALDIKVVLLRMVQRLVNLSLTFMFIFSLAGSPILTGKTMKSTLFSRRQRANFLSS